MKQADNTRDVERYYRHGDIFWRDLIARQEKSGMGVRKFCAAHGVAYSTFHKRRGLLLDKDKPIQLATAITTPHATFFPIFSGSIEETPPSVSKAAPAPSSYSSLKASPRDSVVINRGGVRVELCGSHADRIVRYLIGRLGGPTC